MKNTEVASSLKGCFHQEGHRIVFWHDPEAEFTETVSGLTLPDVTVLHTDQIGFLALKTQIEITEPEGKFLLYSASPEPPVDKDLLLDIRLYSRTFRADQASLLLNELGLVHQSLRTHLSLRKAFFKNSDRTARLKKLIQPTDLEEAIDWKMLAVLTRASLPSPFAVLTQLFREYAESEPLNLNEPPKSWAEVEKYGLTEVFWQGIESSFGFMKGESKNPLHDLLLRILVTDFCCHLPGDPPKSLQHFLLKEKTNGMVFVSQWQRDIQQFAVFQKLSKIVGKELKIHDQISKLPAETLLHSFSFEEIERRVLSSLRDTLISGETFNPDEYRDQLRQRRDGVWTQMKLDEQQDENPYEIAYQALEDALELFLLKERYSEGFTFSAPKAMFEAFVKDLYKFDFHHRRFLSRADKIELLNWDILKTLRESVTNCYEDWFLNQLAANWSSLLEGDGERGLLQAWKLPEIKNQYDFHARTVSPILKKNPRNKVFVIVSDALRYDAGVELTSHLNRTNRVQAAISPMLGVVPSYTALGMAALLPHAKLEFDLESGDLLADGLPCNSFQDRAKILENHEGIALKADELMQLNKDQGREAVQGARLVYIYHDRIDAVGDKFQTEKQTPQAVEQGIEELAAIVKCVINNLNGSYVFITADHGFLFQEKTLSELDKSQLSKKPEKAFIAKKRFILGHGLKKTSKAWHGCTRDTASTNDETEFWIPKGNNRFHFVGGAQYVHGGAMLQEITIPLITIRELEGKNAERAVVRKVGISLLGSSRKIVNNVQKLEFIQTEKVTERNLPITVTVSLRDGDTLISNELTLTFNSESDNMDERKRISKITLKSGKYDKTREYHLVIRDSETQIEIERIAYTIDLAIMNDF